MSKIQDRIKEIEKSAKRSRIITSVLAVIVIAFIVVSGYQFMEIKKQKEIVEGQKTELTNANTLLNSTNGKLTDAINDLKERDSILKQQNDKLLQLRGNIESYWTDAVNRNRMKHYANYLSKAIEGDEHYDEALVKMNELAQKSGYVQVKESNGNVLLEKINNLNTEDEFFTALSDRSIRNGVMGSSDFSNQSRNGDAILTGDVVKVVRLINSGNAEWAEIKYSN